MHQRGDDEIHRHDVDVSAFHAHQRDPARPGLAQLLQRLEEVVRAVDLVDEARLRMTDDGARAVHAPGNASVGAHHRLGVVLGAVIRMVEFLGFLEHVLRERAAIQARRGDGADEVEATGLDGLGELERALGARDVGLLHRLGAGLDVVHRAEVIEMLDLALELREVGLADAQLRLAEVALDRDDALEAFLAPELAQFVELADGLGPHQHVDRALAALQKRLHEETADESGRAGDEIRHRELPWFLQATLGVVPQAGQRGNGPALA